MPTMWEGPIDASPDKDLPPTLYQKELQIDDFYAKIHFVSKKFATQIGALAQLGERYTGSVEVSGSIPLCSTIRKQ